MPGPWKAWKSKSSFPTRSTAPWKSRQQREISTFPQPGLRGHGKVENQNQVSPFPTAARDDDPCSLSQTAKPRKEVGRRAAASSSLFRITLYWKRSFGFRIILGLENAPVRPRVFN
jgi:hypothetical protein